MSHPGAPVRDHYRSRRHVPGPTPVAERLGRDRAGRRSRPPITSAPRLVEATRCQHARAIRASNAPATGRPSSRDQSKSRTRYLTVGGAPIARTATAWIATPFAPTRSSQDLRETLRGPASCWAERRPVGSEDRDRGWCLRPWRMRSNAARSSTARIAAVRAVRGVGPEMTSRAPSATRPVASSRMHTPSCLIARSQAARSISLPRRTSERGCDPAVPTLMPRRSGTEGRRRAQGTQTRPSDHLHALVAVSWRSRSLPRGSPDRLPASIASAVVGTHGDHVQAYQPPHCGPKA